MNECKKSEQKELFGRVTNSTAHEPDVTHEKYEAFQEPEVCSEPEKIPSSPLTLRVKYENVSSTNSRSCNGCFPGNLDGAGSHILLFAVSFFFFISKTVRSLQSAVNCSSTMCSPGRETLSMGVVTSICPNLGHLPALQANCILILHEDKGHHPFRPLGFIHKVTTNLD